MVALDLDVQIDDLERIASVRGGGG